MGFVESLPYTRGIRPVLALPLFLGTFRDHSDYGNHPTIYPDHYVQYSGRDAVKFTNVNRLSIPDSPELQLITGTFFVSGLFTDQSGNQAIIDKNPNYRMYSNAANIRWVPASDAALNYTGSRSIAATFAPATRPQYYTDGTFAAQGAGAVTQTPDPALLIIGGILVNLNQMDLVLIYPGVLTPAEILSLHNWSQSRFTPRKQWPGGGLRYPNRETNLLPDGNFSAIGTADFAAMASAIISKEPSGLPGELSQSLQILYDGVANPHVIPVVYRTAVGTQYQILGEAQSIGGVAAPKYTDGAVWIWTGSGTTEWEAFDETYIAAQVDPRLNSWGAGTGCRFRNVRIWASPPGYTPATGDPLFLDNIQSARVSVGNETSGRLSNTDYFISTGTYRVDEIAATGERFINCIAPGLIYRENKFAYGTWDFELSKAAGGPNFIMGSQPTPWTTAGQDGYLQQWTGADVIGVYRITNGGGAATLFTTAAAYIAQGVRYKYRWTRSNVGLFSFYFSAPGDLLALIIEATGNNPETDNTHTTSQYIIHDLDAGDHLYADRQFAGTLPPV